MVAFPLRVNLRHLAGGVFVFNPSDSRHESIPHLRAWNAKVFADLHRHLIADLRMPWHGGAAAIRRIPPPRVLCALAHEHATVCCKVFQKLSSLHTSILTSSYASFTDDNASARFNSRASRNADRKLLIRALRVVPCPLTPGTSSIQPIHHFPSRLTTAVYVLFIVE